MMQVEAGSIINKRYELMYKVADGGMGELYYVRDLKLNGIARAIKMIKPTYAAAGWHQLLKQEAYLLTRLQHRCLPNIFDFEAVAGEHNRSILVMEWIDGVHLGQLIQQNRERLTLPYVYGIASEVLSALAYLHAQRPSIIHRDLKPSNIMLAKDGTVKLIDFGISKQLGQESGQTQQFGTRGYCAPEQIHGQSTDERSDIYSFGAILLAMLGIDPVIYLAGDQQQELPRKLSYVPKELRQLIIDCVQVQAQHRPQHVTSVMNSLNQIAEMNGWHEHKLSTKPLANLLQGRSGRQSGYQRIAIFSAHAGAGASLLSLSFAHCCELSDIKLAYIDHRRAVPSEQREDTISHMIEQCALQSIMKHVLIDYSSLWQIEHIEDILLHTDWVIVVSSPWIVGNQEQMTKLQYLLQQAQNDKLPVIWISNRDQPFPDRGRWLQLSAGLTHLKVPELSTKTILQSLWSSGGIKPHSSPVKELSKYLMPLIKKVIHLQ